MVDVDQSDVCTLHSITTSVDAKWHVTLLQLPVTIHSEYRFISQVQCMASLLIKRFVLSLV